MPKVSVYLPDHLYRLAKERNLSISKITQRAIEQHTAKMPIDDWVEMMRGRPRLVSDDVDVSELMDAVRAEFDE